MLINIFVADHWRKAFAHAYTYQSCSFKKYWNNLRQCLLIAIEFATMIE